MFKTTKQENFNLSNEKVVSSFDARFLGVYIDNKLKFDTHIKYVTKQILQLLPTVYNIRDYMTKDMKKSFYYSFIYSHISYCALFLNKCSASSLKSLEIQHKKIIKILHKFQKITSTKEVYKVTNLLNLPQIIKYETMSMSHRIFYHNAPINIAKHFQTSKISRNSNFLLSHSGNSLHNMICTTWNGLPTAIKEMNQLKKFKHAIRVFLLS